MSKNGKKIMDRREQEHKREESASTITFKGIEIVYDPNLGLEEDQLALIRPFTEEEKRRLDSGEAVIRRVGDKVYLDQMVRLNKGRPSLVLKFLEEVDDDLVEVVGVDPGTQKESNPLASREEIVDKMRRVIDKTVFMPPSTKETTHGEEAAELPPVHEGGTETGSEPAGRGDSAQDL